MLLLEELCAEAAFCPGLSPFCRHSLCRQRAALGRLSLPQTRLDREIAGGSSVRRGCLSCWGAEWSGDQQVPPLLGLFPAWGSGGRASCPQGPPHPFQGGFPGAGAGPRGWWPGSCGCSVGTSWEMLQPYPRLAPPESTLLRRPLPARKSCQLSFQDPRRSHHTCPDQGGAPLPVSLPCAHPTKLPALGQGLSSLFKTL